MLEDDFPEEEFPEVSANLTVRHKQRGTWLEDLWNDDIFDQIQSSSRSFHARTTCYRGDPTSKSTNLIALDDDICDLDDDGLFRDPFSDITPSGTRTYSGRTSSLLTKLLDQPNPASRNTSTKVSRSDTLCRSLGTNTCRLKRKVKASPFSSDEDVPEPVAPRPKGKRPAKATTQDKAAKAEEREAARLRREQEKEEEKERKRKLKEEKEKAKRLAADIAEVNKLKVNKKESIPEMLIDMSSSFDGTCVGNQVGEFMRHLGVQIEYVSTRLPNMISWRRKVTAFFNDQAGHWEPCPLTIKKEEHVLCFLSAKEFVDLAVASDVDQRLNSHFRQVTQHYPGSKPIYLIEGLFAWMRRNQNVRNRAYQAAILRQMGDNSTTEESSTGNRRSKKQAPGPPIDDDTIEDALLELQVQHNCLIYHTAAAAESAEWIKNFTEHISTIPYRQERANLQDAAFCMDTGQVKTGADADDTYIRMLEEIHRVTAPIAYGVAMEYKSVRKLVNGMDRGGPLRLQDVKVCFQEPTLSVEIVTGANSSCRNAPTNRALLRSLGLVLQSVDDCIKFLPVGTQLQQTYDSIAVC